jgi:NAD(P)-dependent dehydrogenase (short-subunit alcohol dehydrogenase family)
MISAAVEQLGGIDIVVNAAATPASASDRPALADLNPTAVQADLDIKLLGYLRVARAVAPHMITQGWGRIISIGGQTVRSTGNYASSIRNAAVVALTKCLADELGPKGIAVTVVHPGATRTERTAAIIAARAERSGITLAEAEHALYGHSLNGRITDAEEVAAVVAFLASPLGAPINGDSIYAGGGSRKAIHY